MAYGVEKMKLAWAVGRYGDGSWQAAIEHAEKVAIELLAADQDGDALEWAKGFIPWAGQQPHAGDCHECRSWLTAPITCNACVYDEYMAKAWTKMKAEIGPIVDGPREPGAMASASPGQAAVSSTTAAG